MSLLGRRSTRTVVTSSAVALVTLIALAGPVGATGGSGGPTYSAAAAPASVAAGRAGTSTITLTQLVDIGHEKSEYDTLELGSARIMAPAGFTITGASATSGPDSLPVILAGNSVTVNNLELHHPGQTALISIAATVACGSSGATSWTVVAHQTDNYTSSKAKVLTQDPSSALGALVSPCRLAFVAGPADAQVALNISSQQANPAGPPVTVQLEDGMGAPLAQQGSPISLSIVPGSGTAGAVLGGTPAANTGPTGLASFGQLSINLHGNDYQLLAAGGTGVLGATSATFDVDDVLKACSSSCSGTTSGTSTTGQVSASGTSGSILSMSLGVDQLSCNDAPNHFYVSSSQVLSFGITPSLAVKTVTITLAKAFVTKPLYAYQVCFSSPDVSFVNRYGKTIAAGQAGLLPDCSKCKDADQPPCVLARWIDRYGNVNIRFSAPAGDPKGNI
ncbi:MAG: hypothetical protein ACXWQ6_01155 [Candidatus Limnocylindrales bacterium]